VVIVTGLFTPASRWCDRPESASGSAERPAAPHPSLKDWYGLAGDDEQAAGGQAAVARRGGVGAARLGPDGALGLVMVVVEVWEPEWATFVSRSMRPPSA
jgi:hypothetical protein